MHINYCSISVHKTNMCYKNGQQENQATLNCLCPHTHTNKYLLFRDSLETNLFQNCITFIHVCAFVVWHQIISKDDHHWWQARHDAYAGSAGLVPSPELQECRMLCESTEKRSEQGNFINFKMLNHLSFHTYIPFGTVSFISKI